MNTPAHKPYQIRSHLKSRSNALVLSSLADLGMSPASIDQPKDKDEVLERFEICLLTEGSGTQIFSTVFA